MLGFVGAPLLVIMFGLQAVEAIGDLVGKRDSVPSSTASDGGWTGAGCPSSASMSSSWSRS
jgi:hypothetical protein